jgi:hypothetical protein
MKPETKRKIIQWITKCLKYEDTERINPFVIKSQSIVTAKSVRLYYKDELEFVKETNRLESETAIEIAKSLIILHAIKIEESPFSDNSREPKIKVTGTLKFIMP